MANEEQLKVLFIRGVEAWNSYRDDLERSDQSVDLSGANFQGRPLNGIILRSVDLTEANFDDARLEGAQFENAILTSALLPKAVLINANFTNADLTDARLNGARLDHAVLVGARLNSAVLTSANLQKAHLVGADLALARLDGCNFRDADLTDANLQGANLKNANFEGAKYDNAVFEDAVINRDTQGLSGLTPQQFAAVRLDDPAVTARTPRVGESELTAPPQEPEIAAGLDRAEPAGAPDLPRCMVSFSAPITPNLLLNSVFFSLTSPNDVPALDLVLSAVRLEQVNVLNPDEDEGAYRNFVRETLLRMAQQHKLPDAEATVADAMTVVEETMAVVCHSPPEGLSLKQLARCVEAA